MKAPQNLKWDKPRGPRWLREVIEKIFRELTSRTPVEGLGVFIDRTDNGSILSTVAQPGGKAPAAAAAQAVNPFTASPGVEDGSVFITVAPGVIEVTVPTLEAGTQLDANPPPKLFLDEGVNQIYLTAVFNTDVPSLQYSITSVDIDVADPDDPDGPFDKEQGHIVWDDEEFKASGVFFWKIAEVTVTGTDAVIVQFLDDNIRVVGYVGDLAVMLS